VGWEKRGKDVIKNADVKVRRAVDCRQLRWPAQATSYPGYGWNREYENLRGECSWRRAERALEYEVAAVEGHAANAEVLEECPDEDYDEYFDYLLGLDLGIASCVIALNAAGCITHSSCNGGVFGNHHHEEYPLVALFAKRLIVPVLLACAEASGAGLENEGGGGVQVYADDVRKMTGFAGELLNRRKQLSATRCRASKETI